MPSPATLPTLWPSLRPANLPTATPPPWSSAAIRSWTFDGQVWSKPADLSQARQQLQTLRGQTHHLLSALVLYHDAKPVWRHIGSAKLTMASFSDTYLDAYLSRNWPTVATSVGAYQLEAEGIRLFTAIEGDYFTILGLPLLPLLSYLALRGFIPS